MDKSDTPEGQDNTSNHSNDRQNGSSSKHNCSYRDAKPFWKRLATYEFILGVSLFVVGVKVARIYSGQLDQMIDSNRISRQSLQISQRPWIKIKHRIVRPLSFDFVGAAGPAATMDVEDTIENVGNGVALNVVVWEDVIPLDPNMSTVTARSRQEEWCNANKKYDPRSPTQLGGYVLFPHDPMVRVSGMGPPMSTINKAIDANAASAAPMYKSNLAGKVAFVMVGCVIYRSSFDDEGTRPHVTGFLYRMGEPLNNEAQVIHPFISPVGTADKLQLFKFPDGDYAY
jgi:hypothetical protein